METNAVGELVQVQEAVEHQLEVATVEHLPGSHEITVSTQVVQVDGAHQLQRGRQQEEEEEEEVVEEEAVGRIEREEEEGRGMAALGRTLLGQVPQDVKLLFGTLIERYALTKDQLLAIHEECTAVRASRAAEPSAMVVDVPATLRAVANGAGVLQSEGGARSQASPGLDGQAEHDPSAVPMEEGETIAVPVGNGSRVGKMQDLVRSAIESFETSPSLTPGDLGAKRKLFSLEEELNLKPSPFAQELLDRDQTIVAQAIKKYMNQYSIPQREVVEKTSLNQSHLSQHFLHGITMKRSKRIKLYHWFEEDQVLRTGKLLSADGSLNAVLESPKVEGGNRRRPRWKWSPISTQILTEAFKKNHFPTRDQRSHLARVCNEAEIAMNNGSPIRGPEGDTEGITEQRVNTWFTNRRKGLFTPSPTRATASPGTVLIPGLPSLLKTTASAPATPNQGLGPVPSPKPGEEKSIPAIIPANMQALFSQLQQSQSVSTAQSIQTSISPTRGHIQFTPTQGMPLAIALPTAATAAGSVLSPVSAAAASPAAPPSTGTPTPSTEAIPTILSPGQLQALLSQLHTSSPASSHGGQIQLGAHSIPSFITLPPGTMLPSPTINATHPHLTVQTSSQVYTTASPSTSSPPYSKPLEVLAPTLAPNQVQTLLSQLQAQTKIQGTPQLQINPGSAVPFAITLPGVSNEDLSKAILHTTSQQNHS